MSASADKERFLEAISKPVREFNLPSPSRWERSRTYQTCRALLAKRFFERGLDTASHALELEHFDPEFVHYEPSSWLALRWVFRALKPGVDDVLVDFGCGKGRAICEAARHPFARVVGIEISEQLAQTAQTNIDRSRVRLRCQDIECMIADAAQWQVPDDMTIAYLNHPFAGETFRRVIDNIIGSIRRNPRRVRLVYTCPVLEHQIEETGFFRLVKRRRGRGRRGGVVNSVLILETDPVDRRLAHPV